MRLVDSGALAALAALAMYVWSAARHVVDGDNAEFVTIGDLGGVPHPSGYPLYVLWLRAMSWLPAENAAHRAALATAVLGALAVFVLHRACRAWGARPFAATVTVLVFAASPTMSRLSTQAEVFALNVLLVGLVVLLAAESGPVRGTLRGVLLGVVAGLAMSNHMTCTLVAPVGLLGVLRAARESSRSMPVVVATTVVAWLVGLLPYAYLLVAPDTPMSWRSVETIGDVLHHMLRMDYGGPGAFAPARSMSVSSVDNIAALAGTLGRAWLYILPVVGAIGLIAGVMGRYARGETRVAWGALAVSFLLAGPLLVTRFNVPLDGIGRAVCERFYLLPAAILTIPIAVMLDSIGASIMRRIGERSRLRSRSLAAIFAVAGFAALGSRSLPAHSAAIERGARNMLAPLPKNAVAIVSGDYLYFTALYVQLVLGERRDVVVIASGQLLNPSYRRRLHEREGIVDLTPGDKFPSLAIARDVLAQGRPMFVDTRQFNIRTKFPAFPFGLLFRVVAEGHAVPPPREVLAMNRGAYENMVFGYAKPGLDDDYATRVHERYVQIWRYVAKGLSMANDLEGAAFADAMARELAPGRPWQQDEDRSPAGHHGLE